jgi:hypothetical protein
MDCGDCGDYSRTRLDGRSVDKQRRLTHHPIFVVSKFPKSWQTRLPEVPLRMGSYPTNRAYGKATPGVISCCNSRAPINRKKVLFGRSRNGQRLGRIQASYWPPSLAFDPRSFLKLGRSSFRNRVFNLAGRAKSLVPMESLRRSCGCGIAVRYFLVLVKRQGEIKSDPQ